MKCTKLIHDARQLVGEQLTLDKNAVVMVPLVSKVRDYHDAAEVKAVLFPEVAGKAKELTGARHVFVYSHTVRSEDPEYEAKLSGGNAFSHAYARFAHTDGVNEEWQWDWGRKRLQKELGLSEEETSAKRMDVVLLNFWKPYDHEVAKNPLTILDAASLAPEDVRIASYGGGNTEGGKATFQRSAPVGQVLDNAAHRWLYWPGQGVDEALFFKQTDSREGVAKNGFHVSFDDPTSPPGAPGRRSVECRIIVGFPKETGQATAAL